MKTIAVVCEKGGTGKSVIARELYENYKRQALRTSLYSLDGQYKVAQGSKKVENAEVAIVDTPGVLTDNLKHIVAGADVVVIPVRPTPMDIEPFTRTIAIVMKNTDSPIVIAVNGWNRYSMCASFMEWLSQKPWARNVVKIPQSEAIVQAQVSQKSVITMDSRGHAAEAVRTMCTMVSTLAALPVEQVKLKKIDKK